MGRREPSRRIVQESGSAFQIGPGNVPEQADGVSWRARAWKYSDSQRRVCAPAFAAGLAANAMVPPLPHPRYGIRLHAHHYKEAEVIPSRPASKIAAKRHARLGLRRSGPPLPTTGYFS